MTIRTFKQSGQGYGTSPLIITASINNAVVYQGEIPTVDQPVPESYFDLPGDFAEQLFSWELDTAFAGTVEMSFSVTGDGVLTLTDTSANYVGIPNPALDLETKKPAYINGGPDVFGSFYQVAMPEYTLWDPLTNVKINDVVQEIQRGNLYGQWWWTLTAPATFSCTVNILASTFMPPVA
jgi:hypothetical protein